MKKSIILNIVLWSVITLTSCVDLEEIPESKQSAENFYQNEADAISAVNAIYRGLNAPGQSLYNSLMQIGTEMATDDYEAGPRARNAHVRAISGLTHDTSNDRMQELWRQSYDAINRANVAIDRIKLISPDNISEAIRNRTINEAKFLRALNYFNLVRWFGGVPLVNREPESPTESFLYEAATEEQIYTQIISDLQDAESLPAPAEYGEQDAGRATAGAAKSLLAKVYLTRKDWENARKKSEEVIALKWYDLFEDFADVFNVATKNGKEHIFSVQFKGNANFVGNCMAGRSAPVNDEVPGVNGDYADALHIEGGLFDSFSDNDRRKTVTFVTGMISPTDGQYYSLSIPHIHKYYDPAVVGDQYNSSSKNLPVIRYAEVLLIYAEALNEENNSPTPAAYAAIDTVRSRAGIPKLKDTWPSLTADQFRDSVFQERRKELVYEYQRWFDLSRRGADYYVKTLKAAGKINAAPRHIHFPIPQREIDLNPNHLKQNPEWAE
ncbi:MAG: RagB/SusD family nutrient uptake outer membrane protein [Bacteroidales bacterium]|jgi:hypothetical protein|nr:RagB/SusD family nutrient uptake outer membrane protein [Bacteroidales bacterium]